MQDDGMVGVGRYWAEDFDVARVPYTPCLANGTVRVARTAWWVWCALLYAPTAPDERRNHRARTVAWLEALPASDHDHLFALGALLATETASTNLDSMACVLAFARDHGWAAP